MRHLSAGLVGIVLLAVGKDAAAGFATGAMRKALEKDRMDRIALIRKRLAVVQPNGPLELKLPLLRELEQLQRVAADTAGLAGTLSDIGDVFFFQSRYDSAGNCYRQSLALHRAAGNGNGKGEVEALNHVGDALGMAGQYDSTENYDRTALELARRIGDRKGEGLSIRNLGDLSLITGSADSAAAGYRKALELAKLAKDSFGEALALTSLGNVLVLQGRADSALACHRASLALYRRLGSPPHTCAALNNIGDALSSLGLADSAAAYFRQSMELANRIGYRQAQATAANNLGDWHASRSRYDSAAVCFGQNLSIARLSGDRHLEATALTNLGSCQARMGQVDSGVQSFRAALAIQESLHDQDGILASTSNLGYLHQMRGRPDSSLRYSARTLELSRALGRQSRLAGMLLNRGATFQGIGRFDSAARCYREALALQWTQKDRAGLQITNNNLGTLFREWGNLDSASSRYRQSLDLAREQRDPAAQAVALGNLGVLWSHRGVPDSAIACTRASLALREPIGEPREIASAYAGLGNIFQGVGRLDSAFDCNRHALALFQGQGDVHGMSVLFNNLGTLWQGLGKYDSALACYRRTLDLVRKSGDRVGESHVLNNIGVLLDLMKRADSAIVPLEASIRILEPLRETARGELRRDYLASVIGVYANLATAHLHAGHAEKSLEVSELASSRYLAELLGARSGAAVVFRGVGEIAEHLPDSVLVVKFWSGDTAGRITLRYVISRRGLVEAKAIEDTSIVPFIAGFRQAVMTGRPFEAKGKELRAALFQGLDSLLLRSKRLVIVPDGPYASIPWDALPASDGKLLVESMEVRQVQSLAILQHLQLRATGPKADLPLLALGGAVYQRPGVRPDPQVFANSDRALAQPSTGHEVDPAVWLAGLRPGWENLAGSAVEVRNIGKVMTGSVIDTGWNASESRIKRLSASGQLAKYQVLHFATHGLSHPWNPDLNTLVLSIPRDSSDPDDGYLTLREASELKLGAELVVMSACQTGLGIKAGGEGSQTMVDAFLLSGASNVLATLWSVDDRATQRFMSDAYALSAKEGIGLPQAMLRTKRSFLANARRKGESIADEEARVRSLPRYWSAFVVYGW